MMQPNVGCNHNVAFIFYFNEGLEEKPLHGDDYILYIYLHTICSHYLVGDSYLFHVFMWSTANLYVKTYEHLFLSFISVVMYHKWLMLSVQSDMKHQTRGDKWCVLDYGGPPEALPKEMEGSGETRVTGEPGGVAPFKNLWADWFRTNQPVEGHQETVLCAS